MEFCIEKYSIILMKTGRRKTTDWIELCNQESVWTLGENESWKYVGILKVNTHANGDERKSKKGVHQKNKKNPWNQTLH